MRIQVGEMTVGDIGVSISIATNDSNLSGKTITVVLTSPTRETKRFTGTVSSQSVSYTTAAAADIDEPGDWYIDLYNSTTGFHYLPQGQFKVRRKPGDMVSE